VLFIILHISAAIKIDIINQKKCPAFNQTKPFFLLLVTFIFKKNCFDSYCLMNSVDSAALADSADSYCLTDAVPDQ
jgi:hypothetical protein